MMTPDLREAVALTYEEAEKLALQAIHGADGRGMIGRGRNHLHQRVARAILQAHRAALPALSVPEGWVAVGYRYRYPHYSGGFVWRFETGGREINGAKPDRCEAVYALSAIPSPGGEGSSRPWPQPVAQTTAIPPLLDQGDTTTLLEALKGLYDACEYLANREGGDFGPDIGPAAEAARAAIAQANASPAHPKATARPLSAPSIRAKDEKN